MNIHRKDIAAVRRDALEAAVRKTRDGCRGCVDGYLDLARDHGASADELASTAAAIAEASSQRGAPLGSTEGTSDASPSSRVLSPRRPRIALPASAAAGALAAASRVLEVGASYPGMFGTDSNTQPHVSGMPTDFYIGKLGQGTTDSSHQQPVPYFNTNSAGATNSFRVCGFWYMYGPSPAARGSYTPYGFGFKQGQLAVSSWNYNRWCCMENVFADVEDATWAPGSGHSTTDNANCLNGFLDAVSTTPCASCYRSSTTYLIPGVYFNQGAQGSWFPAGYRPSRNFVFWGAGAYQGNPSCPGDVNGCSPCSTCDTLTPIVNRWNSGLYHACFAGQGIAIWQFWVSGCGCGGDWDYSGYVTTTNTADGNPKWGPVPCH